MQTSIKKEAMHHTKNQGELKLNVKMKYIKLNFQRY